MADNIQETFGLTPVEAMAAGLPVLVTDWNGYKDTVRDGIDGFRIPTYMPPAGSGRALAHRYEADLISYDRYCGYSGMYVAVDLDTLTEKLGVLVENPDLRRTMGENGKRQAAAVYDWPVVYSAYQELWRELASIRRAAASSDEGVRHIQSAPREAPGRTDPMVSFEHYPTHGILPDTQVAASERADELTFEALIEQPLFSYAKSMFPSAELVVSIREAVGTPKSVQELSAQLKLNRADLTRTIATLAKMGLLKLAQPKQL